MPNLISRRRIKNDNAENTTVLFIAAACKQAMSSSAEKAVSNPICVNYVLWYLLSPEKAKKKRNSFMDQLSSFSESRLR